MKGVSRSASGSGGPTATSRIVGLACVVAAMTLVGIANRHDAPMLAVAVVIGIAALAGIVVALRARRAA